ncbi:MAG TPA: FAD-linked oxidase C-terminal domain-containing protein [Bacteroidia bacterium]|nr:FAD-linked oxidase C-terminal domain-containing protein [Bacteroidia bacterium]
MEAQNYNRITSITLAAIRNVVGEEHISSDPQLLEKYGQDETEDLVYLAELVVKPGTSEEVSAIARICHENRIPLTTRGAGTGLSGGALPVEGGVVLSTERMNRILEIDTRNLQATVEPGVINYIFQEEVRKLGLFYPPDPASWGSCSLGGNIAHSSGGPKAVKYGTTRDYVLNLEVVLPGGEIIWTGANTLKYSTGYNLTQLMIGSEGTLGIVTRIVFRLLPLPQHDLLMLVPFKSAEQACKAVGEVFMAGITPSAMEFMERDAIEWSMRYSGELSFEIKPEWQALLLIEVDGNNQDILMQDCETIGQVMQKNACDDILFAESAEQKNALWKIRRKVGEAVKSNSVYKEEDTVVPRAELPVLLKGVKEIGARYGFKSVCYGHAGDGNLHVNIIKGELSDEVWEHELPKGITEIFRLCKKLGGTISGEHGIGLVQKAYMPLVFSAFHLDLMKRLKMVFDPRGILNPGKIID